MNAETSHDRERQNFMHFAKRVRDHYEHEHCQRRMYPENVLQYQQNIDFWKDRLRESGLDKDLAIQKTIFETEWLITNLMIGLQGPDAH